LSYARRILALYKKAEHPSAAIAVASSASARQSISTCTRSPPCLGNSPPAIPRSSCKSSSVSVPISRPFSTRASWIS
jgi:hypothetical protein